MISDVELQESINKREKPEANKQVKIIPQEFSVHSCESEESVEQYKEKNEIQYTVQPIIPQTEQPYYKTDKLKVESKRRQTSRHFGALMLKNAINWKRTWCGSILEILCPALLMLLLAGVRVLLKPDTSPDIDMYKLQQPLYPPGQIDLTTQKWSFTNESVAQQGASLTQIMNFTGYKSFQNQESYNPLTDRNSPYALDMKHCYQPTKEFNSPIIAIVKSDSGIQLDLVNQIQALFVAQNQSYDKQGNKIYKMSSNFTFKEFQSKDELFAYIGNDNYGRKEDLQAVCFGFTVIQNSQSDFEFEMFFNDLWPNSYSSIPNQKQPGANPAQQAPLMQPYKLYSEEGFNMLANWGANSVLRSVTMNQNAQIATMIVPMQAKSVVTDNYSTFLQWTLPFFFILMYIPVLYRTVYRIVFEKVTKAKESMRMMGMGDFAYWSSWYAYYTIVNLLIVTVSWGILQINSFSRQSGGILWVWMFLYGQSLYGFVMITQSLFSSPRAAAITTTLIYFGTSILSSVVSNEDSTRSQKIAVCWFFPTVTMITGVQPLIVQDYSGIGLTASNLSYEFGNFTVKDSFWLFFVGGLQMLLIGFYLEYALPTQFGYRRHPCFFITCLCNRSKKLKSQDKYLKNQNSDLKEDDENTKFETQFLKRESYEPVPSEIAQKETLKISGLKKIYDNGFTAVNGINLKMYQDQIFVLLGHNGAGKTTLISILTGLFGASEGNSEVFGFDMFNDMSSVRQLMGVCPQHDILFELLTVQEHISFFYDLKGAPRKGKNEEIVKLMKDVGVYDKRNALAYTLSGGNKRKLSVAIALCGNSKFVLLDEPTSGLDLSARRQLWNMLKEYKKDRIIVLTTHYMDEADILGDRIGIMASGKLTALGSSIFLKSTFGVGYNLTVVKENSEPNPDIMQFMFTFLGPNVIKQSEIQSEMTIQIPLEYSSKFSLFFQNFDSSLKQLQIQSYGISISTLEEVFLKIGHLDDPTKQVMVSEDNLDKGVDTHRAILDETKFNLQDNQNDLDQTFLNNLKAVLYKRFSNYKRNKKQIFLEAVVPALIMIVGIGLSKISPSWQSPSRIIDPSRLPSPQKLLMNTEPVITSGSNLIPQLQSYIPKSFALQQVNQTNLNLTEYGNIISEMGYSIANKPPFQYGSYYMYQVDTIQQQYQYMSFVNLTSQDASSLYPIFMYEPLLKLATNNENFKFKIRMTPFPPTYLIKARMVSTATSTVLFVSAIAYSVMIVAVASYLVVERTSGLKHLQIISGMQLKAYWIGNFIFDFFKFEFTICITIILFFAFQMDYPNASIVYAIFPFGILPFTYVTSFIFTSDNAAQTFTMFFNFLILGIGTTVIYFLRLAATLQNIGDAINYVLHIFPTYTLGAALYCDSGCLFLSQSRLNPASTGSALDANEWATTNISMAVWVNFIHLIFWSLQIYLIENGFYRFCQRNIKAKTQENVLDNDVLKEEARVNQPDNQDLILVQQLQKIYQVPSGTTCVSDSLVAVNKLSFGLTRGECFALLGVNGAGKSTTFKSLIREVTPSSGLIKIAGLNIQSDFENARKLIGYCPQANLIFEEMTVDEHLIYYVQIKGIPKVLRKKLVEQVILNLGLGMHRNKPAGTLSGGNKRKLCVALALIGNPPIIFLDEPSAGMDPESRRFMWSIVGQIAQQKSSAVVLTTHSMDEAEALSTKMGIMVKGGVFKCFGSGQHIKNKFGTGFVIEIKIKTLNEDMLQQLEQKFIQQGEINLKNFAFHEKVKQIIETQAQGLHGLKLVRQLHGDINLYMCIQELCVVFEEVELLEKYGSYMRLRVARLEKSIGYVFGLVEGLRLKCDVSEYSVSQTSLEQIFQSFANISFIENVQKFIMKRDDDEESVQKLLTIKLKE